MALLSVRVAAVGASGSDTATFVLVPADPATELPPVEAGAHIDVHLPGGIVRQYSLTNGPDQTQAYHIAVKREAASRGGSAAMHELTAGVALTIGEPRNAFPLAHDAEHHVLLAAGIGVTPILSMARHVYAAGRSFELHYFFRTPESAPFYDAFESAPFADRVKLHAGLDAAAVRTTIESILSNRTDGAHVYYCGPAPFMELIHEGTARTWPAGTTHFELFAPQIFASDDDGSFTVELARAGRTFGVGPNETIIDVLARNGVAVDLSCEVGICGTCVTRVLGGVPDHRDQYLSASEHESGHMMTICVSRALTPSLVLDL